MNKDDVYDLEQKRIAFQNVFKNHPDGPLVLSVIRNELGVNNYEEGKVKPDLIVFEHWLMYMIGAKHPQNFLNETKGLLSAVNDDDIQSEYRVISEREEKPDEPII